MDIERNWVRRTGIVICSTVATATGFRFSGFSGGMLKLPDTIASVTFTFHGCDTEDGTYVPLYSYTGVAITATGPGNTACMVEIPPACFGSPFLKIQCNGDAAGGESITVLLKS